MAHGSPRVRGPGRLLSPTTQSRRDGAVFSLVALGNQIFEPKVTTVLVLGAINESLVLPFHIFPHNPLSSSRVMYIAQVVGDAILLKFLRGLFISRALCRKNEKVDAGLVAELFQGEGMRQFF